VTHIQTHSTAIGSLFQSLAEDVAQRIDQREGTASPERGTDGSKRPTLQHPVIKAAAEVAHKIENGEPLPASSPAAAPADGSVQPESFGQTVKDCASITAQILLAKAKGDMARAAQLEDDLKFSTCDIAWSEAIKDYVEYFGLNGSRREIPYVRYQNMEDFVIERLPANARIALFGDWGTGTEDAVDLLQQVAKHDPDVLIHLGDIYYAGTPDECQKYFLDIVDRVFDRGSGRVPVYNLCGNHDVYSGGAGFYGLLPKLNPTPPFDAGWAQQASYFALRSPNWQLLGMDTGLHDHDPFDVNDNITYLEPEEEAWHRDKIRSFSEKGGRTILLSHHQLFSGFSRIGKTGSAPSEGAINPKLLNSWESFKAAGDVAAWFWGHEHNLCIYESFAGLDKGRCIGHGAIPSFTDPNPYDPIKDVTPLPALVDDPAHPGKKLQLGVSGPVYDHGFVILQLDDTARTAKASYYQASQPDTPMYEEVI
jgi:hypothetical protein